jgi:hypothetical protein
MFCFSNSIGNECSDLFDFEYFMLTLLLWNIFVNHILDVYNICLRCVKEIDYDKR